MFRVRFAPSPTGFLHVGTAKIALYNFLLARKEKGKFILRIEDTDIERSSSQLADVIIESLEWLGLNWDEGPYFQSERKSIYKKYADELLKKKFVYPCYCTKEEIEERKKIIMKNGKSWKYDRRRPNLFPAEQKKLENRPYALRFFVNQSASFIDMIHGELKRDRNDISDFVIMKSDGMPTYNFACVIDDHLMEINCVIRGEDHISNTHKQLLLYNAFGWKPPKFAHLPLILGPDKSKLSKRHGALSVLEYRNMGFLPEALVNFLALLGWSPGDNREILSMDELVHLFSIDRIGKTGAVFDIRKLEWMNGEYIKNMSDEELLKRVIPFIRVKVEKEYLLKVIEIMKERVKRLTDFWDFGSYFFIEPKEYEEKGVKKHFNNPYVIERLQLLRDKLNTVESFDVGEIENTIRTLARELNIGVGKLIHPMRLAITGTTVGPSLFHLTAILGKNKVIDRLDKAIEFLSQRHPIKMSD